MKKYFSKIYKVIYKVNTGSNHFVWREYKTEDTKARLKVNLTFISLMRSGKDV